MLGRGASVVITGRSSSRLSEAESNLLKISSLVVAHNIDESDESQVTKSLKDTYDAFGKIDGLVNNAPSIHTGKIIDLEMSSWRTNFKANLDAVLLLQKQFYLG